MILNNDDIDNEEQEESDLLDGIFLYPSTGFKSEIFLHTISKKV